MKITLLDTELRGIDETNEVVIFERTVPLTVNPQTKGSPLASAGVVGGLVVVGAVVARRYLKNKR